MLLIDNMAGSRNLILHPPLNDPSIAQLSHLESADVMFSGNGPEGPILIGIEIKSLPDLISSIGSGRLQDEQIPKMVGDIVRGIPPNYDLAWLAYYGEYRPNPETSKLQIRLTKNNRSTGQPYSFWCDYNPTQSQSPHAILEYSYIESFFASPSFLSTGIRAVRLSSIEECAQWIYALYKTWARPYASHKSMRVFNKISDIVELPASKLSNSQLSDNGDIMALARVANSMPGIGFEKAMRVAKYFSSIEEMMAADQAEWVRAGLGKVLAKSVWGLIRRRKGGKSGI